MMSDKCRKKKLSVDFNSLPNASVSVYIKGENETAKKFVSDTDGNKISYSINKSFSEQVDEVLNGLFDKTNMLYVKDTNDIMRKVFNNDFPVLMTPKHVETTYYSEGKYENANYHDLGEIIKQIPSALDVPIMVVQSWIKPDNAVFITELKDKQHNNLIVPIDIDTKAKFNNVFIDSNILNTVYAKENLQNILSSLTAGDILYIDNDKSRQLFLNQGLQLPNILKLNGFIHSVRKSNQKVNYQTDGNYLNDMQIALEKAGLLNSIDQKQNKHQKIKK